MNAQNPDIACDPSALTPAQREQFTAKTESLLANVQGIREPEDGFAFRFLNQPDSLVQIAEFIRREGVCCPFLRFSLEVGPEQEPVWLSITGQPGTKQFLQTELVHPMKQEKA